MNIKMPSLKTKKTKGFKLGAYSTAVTLIVIAIVIVLNMLFEALPGNITQLDMSASKLYSISSNTKVVVNPVEKDVTIYWISQSGKENSVIEKLLSKYEALNSHIKVVKKNPDTYPTFAQQYTDGDVYNNDLIVECGERYRYISINDIIEYDTSNYYTSGTYDVYFDGEGEITSAVSYVVSEDLPKIYLLSGHGEEVLSDGIKNALAKANYETESISLLTSDSIPEDADCLLINGPTSDISEKEAEMITDYISSNGSVLVFAGPAKEDVNTNLNSVLENYGLEICEGIVIEGDRNSYAFGMPYALIPSIEEAGINEPLIEEEKNIIMPISSGITETEYYRSTLTVTPLLSASAQSFVKNEGYELTSYEKDEDDTDGPFYLAVAVEDSKDSKNGRMVWISSSYLLDDTYDSYSSGANTDFAMNSISWLAGKTDVISIRSKSLNNEYLTINESEASFIKILTLGVVPAFFVIYGAIECIRRRKFA